VNEMKRGDITDRYLKGEVTFADVSFRFLLCRCQEREYPHEPHRSDLIDFNLEAEVMPMGFLSKLAKGNEGPEERLSDEARKRIAEAQTKRWAKYREEKEEREPSLPFEDADLETTLDKIDPPRTTDVVKSPPYENDRERETSGPDSTEVPENLAKHRNALEPVDIQHSGGRIEESTQPQPESGPDPGGRESDGERKTKKKRKGKK
jgi:hypothetical protein